MSRLLFLFPVFLLIVAGCNETEENIIWQGTYGQGNALFVKTTSDTGFVSAGTLEGKQYLLFLKNDKSKGLEYKPDLQGVITSVWTESGYFITAGSTGGKMFLSKIDIKGTVVWDSVFESASRIDYTSICRLGTDSFLAVGTPDPDSTVTAKSVISFVWFNSSGFISLRKDITNDPFAAAKSVAADNSGNLFLAMTRLGTSGNLKASVAKFNDQLQKLWERDLYNNPLFGASSLAITLDGSGNPVVAGRTGMQVSTGVETTTFITKYYHTGDSVSNNYLEYSNAGYAVMASGNNQYYVLNRKCIVINIVDQNMEYSGIIRTFSSCDPKNTQNYGNYIDITSDGNLIIAGSSGSNYYLVIKSSSAISPV
jgi:hypothetical protein